jgi:PAS domain S-box-containing protein
LPSAAGEDTITLAAHVRVIAGGNVPESPPETVEVLLVDDRAANLQALEAILKRPDYSLVFAESGEEALRCILDHDFAAMLIDVNMPFMDGFELAATIKRHAHYSTIPILFVTATPADHRHIFEAYRVGAVDYLEKPLDEHVVRSKVAVFVQLHRQRREIARQGERLRILELERIRLEATRRYRNLAEAIPQIVWIATRDGEVEFVNRHWEAATGTPFEESLGARWRSALHEDDLARFDAAWARGVDQGGAIDLECRLATVDGGYRWYLFRASPEREDGVIARWLGTFTDVDDQKRAEQGARAAIALRDEFLSVASHELRTPLTPLQLQLQSLLRTVRAEGRGDAAESRIASAIRQTGRLNALVDNLLDVSRISNGRLTLAREDCDLAEVVREVAERFHEEVTRMNCRLTVDAPGPVRAWADRLRMEQVVTNLLSNAVKYAAGALITLQVKEQRDRCVLVVRDEGIGIEAGDLARIFERFERAVPANNYGGLGLGLYIARQIVAAHGGTIHAESTPNEGTTFTVELPRLAREESTESRATARIGGDGP